MLQRSDKTIRNVRLVQLLKVIPGLNVREFVNLVSLVPAIRTSVSCLMIGNCRCSRSYTRFSRNPENVFLLMRMGTWIHLIMGTWKKSDCTEYVGTWGCRLQIFNWLWRHQLMKMYYVRVCYNIMEKWIQGVLEKLLPQNPLLHWALNKIFMQIILWI